MILCNILHTGLKSDFNMCTHQSLTFFFLSNNQFTDIYDILQKEVESNIVLAFVQIVVFFKTIDTSIMSTKSGFNRQITKIIGEHEYLHVIHT